MSATLAIAQSFLPLWSSLGRLSGLGVVVDSSCRDLPRSLSSFTSLKQNDVVTAGSVSRAMRWDGCTLLWQKKWRSSLSRCEVEKLFGVTGEALLGDRWATELSCWWFQTMSVGTYASCTSVGETTSGGFVETASGATYVTAKGTVFNTIPLTIIFWAFSDVRSWTLRRLVRRSRRYGE